MNWFKKLFNRCSKEKLEVIFDCEDYQLLQSTTTHQYITSIKDNFQGDCLQLYRKSEKKLNEILKNKEST